MANLLELERARRACVVSGDLSGTDGVVRPEVLASWARSLNLGVARNRVAGRFAGNAVVGSVEVACAEEVFEEFFAGDTGICSLVLLDESGVVRVRRDGGAALRDLLDGAALLPGYAFTERSVGTTAASIALAQGTDVSLAGPEHFHDMLTWCSESAAIVRDEHTDVRAVVLVVCHQSAATPLQASVARMLARQISARVAAEPGRGARLLADRFGQSCARGAEWVVATDGQLVQTNPGVRRLDPADERVLVDLALANRAEAMFAEQHVDLPSGQCAEVTVEGVYLDGDPAGCVLAGGLDGGQTADPPEAVRRQGAHVAPMILRDFAKDQRRSARQRLADPEARIRANRELLTPFVRAQHEVITSVTQYRNRLLTGESGTGKHTLVVDQFRRHYPLGRVLTVDCAALTGETESAGIDRVASELREADGRPRLLALRGVNTLTSVGVRRVETLLRPLTVMPARALVIGCVDTPAVDATRPYGLLLKYFHEITRMPSLRYRIDEIGGIARSILGDLAPRRSLRLGLQVTRVLEGYAWPGNISELKDVLKYVIAHKPLGEVQPPDLPSLCFQGRAQKLTMLEAAQCDAIIQALYEARGNRYKTASMLGIARSSLYRKLDAFGISYIA